jgi:HNH endonuclease/Homeodomain-like domain
VKVCKVDNCERPVKARGFCNAHYQRFKKYGDPNILKQPWQIKVDFVVEENGCFVCTSHKRDKHGYPHMYWNNKHYLVHRFVYEKCFGEIPKGLVVRHKCDNPPCINPEHLELGTFEDNMNDRIIRGRTTKGEKCALSKLKEREVIEIKKMLLDGKSLGEISQKFNISKSTVCDIRAGRSWRHVDIS